jgi:hypothetical protein
MKLPGDSLAFADVLTGKKNDTIRVDFHQRALIVELLARKPSGVQAWIESDKLAYFKSGVIFSGVALLGEVIPGKISDLSRCQFR